MIREDKSQLVRILFANMELKKEHACALLSFTAPQPGGYMLVFIRMLPESATLTDLAQLVDRSMQRPWSGLFRNRGNYDKLRILKITDRDKGSTEYHGLLEIEPAEAALAAIRRLNNLRLNGQLLQARRYFRRSPYLDRRGQMPGSEELKFMNRRTGDRRRSHLEIESVDTAGTTRAMV